MPTSPGHEEAPPSSEIVKALKEMLPLVSDELRLLARDGPRKDRPEYTLQRTALMHQAYLRLLARRGVAWQNRGHFLNFFAGLMRETLTTRAVVRNRAQGGENDPTELILEFYRRREIDVTAIDQALDRLEAIDPRQAQIVELRLFAGLTVEEIARLLEISTRTVKREWAVAKLWFRQALSQK